MAKLRVIGRPDGATRFETQPHVCPACAGGLEDLRWYSRDGGMLMAECAACGCHFGVSGVGFDPEDPNEDPCSHVWAEGIEPDGVTSSGADRCIRCGATV